MTLNFTSLSIKFPSQTTHHQISLLLPLPLSSLPPPPHPSLCLKYPSSSSSFFWPQPLLLKPTLNTILTIFLHPNTPPHYSTTSMGKKPQILPSLFRAPSRKLPWQFFPPCAFSPKTVSFRSTAAAGDNIFRTVNSVYFDPVEAPDPWFTTSSESAASFTTEDDVDRETYTEESVEMVVRGVRSSERLFFDPDDTRSILEQAKAGMGFPFKESEVLAMESEDPYGDFRKSMEEMVESHGVRDWEGLEELLGWYLKVNGKNNHAFIVEAFVDLLVSLSKKKNHVSPSSTSNYSSALSSFSSSSSLRVSHSHEALNDEVVDEVDHH